MKTVNLFGEVVDIVPDKPKSIYQQFKRANNYRLYTIKSISCKTCKHLSGFDYHNKRYYKCELIGISHSEATDIRLKNVCNKWAKS